MLGYFHTPPGTPDMSSTASRAAAAALNGLPCPSLWLAILGASGARV
jgi:hypothetical protein